MAQDGSVVIDTRLSTGSLRQDIQNMNGELNRIGDNMPDVQRRMEREMSRSLSQMERHYRRHREYMSEESQRMYFEMRRHQIEQRNAMRGFINDQTAVQFGFHRMAVAARDYQGTNEQFLSQLQEQGNAQRQLNDRMMAANTRMTASIQRQAGTMLAMSTAGDKMRANYERMGRSIYNVNNGLLSMAGSLQRVANAGQPAVIALRQLGPTANAKQLNDLIMQINRQMMGLPIIAGGAAIAVAGLFKTLHEGAMQNQQYSEAFENMMNALKKAAEPLVTVFAMVMIPLFKLVTLIAEMIIKFNEAYPTLSKVVAGFLILIPVLVLILSPMALGIGLIAGYQAALGALWPIIGPVVTGLAAMMGTVVLVSAAIAALTGATIYLWKTNEGFRNFIVGAWAKIKSVFSDMASLLGGILGPMLKSAADSMKEFGAALKTAFETGDFSAVFEKLAQLIPMVIGLLVGGVPAILLTVARFLPAIAEKLAEGGPIIAEAITGIFQKVATFLENEFPKFIEAGVKIITALVEGLVKAIPLISQAFVSVITSLTQIITTILPVILQVGIQIIQALVDGIVILLPVVVQLGLQLITALVQGIMQVLPSLLQALMTAIQQILTGIIQILPMLLETGVQLIMTLIQGILSMLPTLIDTAVQLITMIIDTIITLLPMIIEIGIQILMTLIEGIISALPQLIEAVIMLITKLVEVIVQNLPKILEAGVKILTSLIQGIVSLLPKLLAAILMLIVQIVATVVQNLPKILAAGVQILATLIKGILSILGQLISAVAKIIATIVSNIMNALVKMIELGVKILMSIISGIVKTLGQLTSTITSKVWNAIKSGFSTIIKNAVSIGSDIINGVIRGITNMGSKVGGALKGVMNKAISGVKSMLGIHSPSRLFRDEIGEQLPAGVAVGVEGNQAVLNKSMKGMVAQTMDSAEIGLRGSPGGTTTNNYTESKPTEINIHYSGENAEVAYDMLDMIERGMTARQLGNSYTKGVVLTT